MQLWVQRLAGRRWALEVQDQIEVSTSERSCLKVQCTLAEAAEPWSNEKSHPLQVAELRQLVAKEGGLPVDRLKLILKGKPLQDGDRPPRLQAEGELLGIYLQILAPCRVGHTVVMEQ